MKRALITGASGFTGRHLASLLQNEGVNITALRLRGSEVCDTSRVTAVLKREQPDYIFHLAGIATGNSVEDFFRVNVLYATTLLRAAQDADMKERPILFVGTAAEYGTITPADLPLKETSICHPYNYYGMSKLMQTLSVIAAAESEERRLVVVRPFNIVGTGMPGHLALASFARQLEQIKRGNSAPIIKVGNLGSKRDFIDVQDVVRLCWILIRCETAYGEIINLCTGIATPTSQLLDQLIKASSVRVNVEFAPHLSKELDIELHYGSNEKARRLIGDFKYTPIEQTIRRIAP